MVAIGIDLGTTFSCVGIYLDGGVKIILNEHGEKTTPSHIGFSDDGAVIVGKYAKTCGEMVFDVKRLIGRKFKEIQNEVRQMPYLITAGESDEPMINVGTRRFSAVQLSSEILKKLKKNAEEYTGETVDAAVITVPAYFNNEQRNQTKLAGELADLNVLRIINEPTAAAIAYGLDKKREQTVLVFDLGGGTMDVSLLTIEDGYFEVKATNGNSRLGGEDFNNRLVVHCLKEFCKNKEKGLTSNIIKNKNVLGKLRTACEKAKIALSNAKEVDIVVDSLFNGEDFFTRITRAKFEILCNTEFGKCLKVVDELFANSQIPKERVDNVILVGGSTRIPKIGTLLSDYFGKEPKKDLNPDEAVAYGAAIQAAILSPEKPEELNLVLVDVTPLSLGIETYGGVMTKIVERNHTIPCCKEEIFSTFSDNQPDVTIRVYEGERKFVKDNHLLGNFKLINIPPMARGIPKILVKFRIDVNGILNVSASEESTGISKNITIKNDKYTKEAIQDAIVDSIEWEESDNGKITLINAKNKLETYLYNLRNTMSDIDLQLRLGEDRFKKTYKIVTDHLHWFDNHKDADESEYVDKQRELETMIRELLITD